MKNYDCIKNTLYGKCKSWGIDLIRLIKAIGIFSIIIILIAIQSFVTQIFFNNIFIFYFLIYYALMERSEK